MFWYVLLNVLMAVFVLVALAAFGLFCVDGYETPFLALIALVAFLIAGGCSFGSGLVAEAHTTVVTDVVEMGITERDFVTVDECYITVGDEYLIEVTSDEYIKLNEGDIVSVKVETETTFGITTEHVSLG